MPKIPAVLAVAALGLAACIPVVIPGRGPSADDQMAATLPAPNPCTATPREAALADALLSRINAARQAEGRGPVQANARFAQMAQDHACDQAVRGALAHKGSDGAGLMARALRGGRVPDLIVENVGTGPADPDGIMALWMASPDHRKNLLTPRASDAGLGIHIDAGGRLWWVMILARP